MAIAQFRAAYSNWTNWIGYVLTFISVTSLVKALMHLKFPNVIDTIIEKYTYFRDIVISPLVWIVEYKPWEKDLWIFTVILISSTIKALKSERSNVGNEYNETFSTGCFLRFYFCMMYGIILFQLALVVILEGPRSLGFTRLLHLALHPALLLPPCFWVMSFPALGILIPRKWMHPKARALGLKEGSFRFAKTWLYNVLSAISAIVVSVTLSAF